MQCLQDQKQSNLANLNNVRCKTSRHFSVKRKEYLKDKIDELDTNSKIKNIGDLLRGINDSTKGYMFRTDIVKDKKGDLVAHSHSILARWRNHFSHQLNVHGVNDIRQPEIHTHLNPVTFRLTWLFKSQKYTNQIDQILAELIKAGDKTIRFEIHKFINSVWNKEELPGERKESIAVPVYKKGDKTDCSN